MCERLCVRRWFGDLVARNWGRGRKVVDVAANRKARGTSREMLGDDRIRDLATRKRHMRAFIYQPNGQRQLGSGEERKRGR